VNGVLNRWTHFWFEPRSPTDLGVSRFVFFIGLLAFYSLEDFSAWGNVSRAFWMPLPLFSAFHLNPLSTGELQSLQILWRASLFLSAVGLFARASMVLAAVVGAYLLGLPHNFGQTFHFDALLVVTCFVLAFSRAGDACSLDAMLGRTAPVEGGRSGEYTWPLRMIWVATSLVFLAAGLAKLRYGGLAWVWSDNMQIVLLRAAYHVSDADPLSHLGLWIARHPWIARGLAGLALMIELFFVLALVSWKARVVLVPAAFCMLVGIRVLMGPTFGGFLLVTAFWLPWEATGERLAVWRDRRRALLVARGRFPVAAEDLDHRAPSKEIFIEHLKS
jgi:hypothetical protein